MEEKKGNKPKKEKRVILLEDLVPREEVKGGARKKVIFGQGANPLSEGKKNRKEE